jgi:hypothetical protein
MNETQAEEALTRLKVEEQKKYAHLDTATRKHKSMKRTFKGIYDYPTRNILYEIGQRNAGK